MFPFANCKILVSVGASIFVLKHQNQEQLGEEMVNFSLKLSGHTPSLREVRAGTWKQNWSKGHGGTLHTSSVCFIIQRGPCSQKWQCPQRPGPAHINLPSSNTPQAFPQPHLMEAFFFQSKFPLPKWIWLVLSGQHCSHGSYFGTIKILWNKVSELMKWFVEVS